MPHRRSSRMTPVLLRLPPAYTPLGFLTTEGLPFTAHCPARPIPASSLTFLSPGLAARRLYQLITARSLRPCRTLLIFGPVSSATASPSTSYTADRQSSISSADEPASIVSKHSLSLRQHQHVFFW